MIGKSFKKTAPHLLGTVVPGKLANVVRTKETVSLGEVHYVPNSSRTYEVKAFPFHHNCVAAVFEDVTEQKKKERKLIKAEKDMEKALKAKAEFLANMSHGMLCT